MSPNAAVPSPNVPLIRPDARTVAPFSRCGLWLDSCCHTPINRTIFLVKDLLKPIIHDGGGLLDPKDAFKSLFHRGKVPVRGSIGVSVEEGLLRSIAADAAGSSDSAL